jgi:hypothetical protein
MARPQFDMPLILLHLKKAPAKIACCYTLCKERRKKPHKIIIIIIIITIIIFIHLKNLG